MLKKTTGILLLCIYLFGATDAYQLLKLPLLVTHYEQHKHENPGITLMQFFKMHYTGEIKIDSDFQQDMQLPFKTHETECCLTLNIIVPPQIQVIQQLPEPVTKEYTLLNDDVPSSLITQSIFQPPRI